MINHLTASGIKNSEYSGPIAQVQLLSGANRTGKTAISEALRLALTNDAEIGGTPAKQSLLVAESASAHASGGGVECAWEYRGGKRRHLLTFEGMEVKSLQGGLPVTVPEFWALTGDERWGLLEGVVGKFTLPAPPDAASLKAKIKSLKEQPQPEVYTGAPIAEVQADLNDVLTEIAKQQKVLTELDTAKERNRKILDSRNSSDRSLEFAKQRLKDAQQATINFAMDYTQTSKDIFEWALSPASVLAGLGSTVRECEQNLWREIQPKLAALSSAGSDWASSVLGCSLAGNDNPIEQCDAANRACESMRKLGFTEMHFTDAAKASQHLEQRAARLADELAMAKEGLELIQTNHDLAYATPLLPESPLDMESYNALLSRRDSLKGIVASANAWMDWESTQAKNKEQITELEKEAESLEQKHAAYQLARGAYLAKAIALVEDKANAVLSSIGWPVVSVKIDQSGKRNTLTLNAGGVDVAAMSGGEALVYGAAVLNAIQEGSSSKCPLMIVEAAELDAENLLAFATAIQASRTKGNVVIASHVEVPFPNALRL